MEKDNRFNNEHSADRRALCHGSYINRIVDRIIAAWLAVKRHPWKISFFAAYIVGSIWLYSYLNAMIPPGITEAVDTLVQIGRFLLAAILFLGAFFIVLIVGTPKGSIRAKNGLMRAGVVNARQEAPMLIDRYREGKIVHLILAVRGTPTHLISDKIAEVESALNIHIGEIKALTPRRIEIVGVPGRINLPGKIEWDENKLPENVDCVSLGQSYTGKIVWDMATTPHILIAGATGSGKTVLVKSVVYQLLCHNAEVTIVDFKLGGDYPREMQEFCEMCFELEDAEKMLEKAVLEMVSRFSKMREAGVSDIRAYDAAAGTDSRRIVFVVDELAELLDKTGHTKEEKAVIERIESYISKIARLGRAAGVSLVLAMQRPDANVLSGQIKNNVTYRVCGRADNVLSQLVLDDVRAEERIPKDAKGLFVTHENVVFKGYWHNNFKI